MINIFFNNNKILLVIIRKNPAILLKFGLQTVQTLYKNAFRYFYAQILF